MLTITEEKLNGDRLGLAKELDQLYHHWVDRFVKTPTSDHITTIECKARVLVIKLFKHILLDDINHSGQLSLSFVPKGIQRQRLNEGKRLMHYSSFVEQLNHVVSHRLSRQNKVGLDKDDILLYDEVTRILYIIGANDG